MDRRKRVADALGADGEGFPDGLGAGGFAGVVGEAQAGGAGFGVEGAKGLGAAAALVAAKADADDGGVLGAHFGGFAEDALGFGHGEVAYGVEDPVEREAKLALAAFAGALQTGEDGLEARGVVVAPHVDDADGDVDLGMDDALRGEMLHHAPGDEFVIFGIDEAAGDGLEGLDEAGEVGELVDGFGFGKGERLGVVARAQLDERGGQDGAFEMEMKLGLGEAADERARCRPSFECSGLSLVGASWCKGLVRSVVFEPGAGCGEVFWREIRCAVLEHLDVPFDLLGRGRVTDVGRRICHGGRS